MLKQLITWKDFTGQITSRTLYFNLTRYEIAHDMELEVLEQRFKRFQDDVIGDSPRDMSPPEIREMLDIFKTIIKHAYGIRSQDGKRFSKNEEIWDEFVETGAFDAFIWYMFEDASRADNFMSNIWPEEIQEAAAKVRAERPDVRPVQEVDVRDGMGLTVDEGSVRIAPDDNIPSIESSEKTWDQYTEQELLSLDDIQFQQLMMRSRDGRNLPQPLLIVSMKRMNGGNGESSEGPHTHTDG